MNNTITMTLGGVDQTLKFNLRTLNYIGEITGKDPIQLGLGTEKWTDSIEQCSVIITAALLSANHGKENSTFEGTPKEEHEIVKEWVLDLQPADLYKIMQKFVAFMNPGIEPKEGGKKADTQQQAPELATV